MAAASTNGMTALATMDSGLKIKLRDWECTLGWMVDSTKANGWTTTWKAWEFTSGTMVENTKDSTKMIKSMALVSTPGLMKDATQVTGTKENNMV